MSNLDAYAGTGMDVYGVRDLLDKGLVQRQGNYLDYVLVGGADKNLDDLYALVVHPNREDGTEGLELALRQITAWRDGYAGYINLSSWEDLVPTLLTLANRMGVELLRMVPHGHPSLDRPDRQPLAT